MTKFIVTEEDILKGKEPIAIMKEEKHALEGQLQDLPGNADAQRIMLEQQIHAAETVIELTYETIGRELLEDVEDDQEDNGEEEEGALVVPDSATSGKPLVPPVSQMSVPPTQRNWDGGNVDYKHSPISEIRDTVVESKMDVLQINGEACTSECGKETSIRISTMAAVINIQQRMAR
jgi:hypothetical protein